MNGEEAVLFVMTLLILAGVCVLWMAMANRRRFREMEHRERLALIERGLIPSPELNPGKFEVQAGLKPVAESPSAARTRSAGVMMIGLGLALMLLITFVADAAHVGVGVGGAFALLGAAFFVNSLLSSREQGYQPLERPRPVTRSVQPPEPPGGTLP